LGNFGQNSGFDFIGWLEL
jgi:hypothetical protein